MALKTVTVTIPMDDQENRDKGKVFLLTEMPATQAEKWAARAMLALGRADVEVPEEVFNAGMAGIAVIGIRSILKMHWGDAEPLLDEMMECIQVMPDPTRPQVLRRLVENDIEEVTTRVKLRGEVFDLHTGFFKRVAELRQALATTRKNQTDSSNTKMSPELSEQSSPPEEQPSTS